MGWAGFPVICAANVVRAHLLVRFHMKPWPFGYYEPKTLMSDRSRGFLTCDRWRFLLPRAVQFVSESLCSPCSKESYPKRGLKKGRKLTMMVEAGDGVGGVRRRISADSGCDVRCRIRD
jgi:hypothetical protein